MAVLLLPDTGIGHARERRTDYTYIALDRRIMPERDPVRRRMADRRHRELSQKEIARVEPNRGRFWGVLGSERWADIRAKSGMQDADQS
jgi:hypothetical protein